MNPHRWTLRRMRLGSRSGRRAVVLLFIASLLAVFSAPIWHHHAEDAAAHDEDCPVCLAVSTPTGDGIPDLPVFEPPALGELVRWMGHERWAVLWAGRDRASRGPPVLTV